MSEKPMVSNFSTNQPGHFSSSTTGTSDLRDGPSEDTVIGDLEHFVHLEEERPREEQFQSLYFLCYSVHNKR